jgi:hypothetical protein
MMLSGLSLHAPVSVFVNDSFLGRQLFIGLIRAFRRLEPLLGQTG